MSSGFFKEAAWLRLRKLRKWQGMAGNIAAVLFALALIAMTDGLIASMRKGSGSLDMLPGQTLALSGPAASRNPLMSDVLARFNPQDCPLRFELEGFFTGYWFGSGMWRGAVMAEPDIEEASCRLTISFRGMPGSSAQNYEIRLFPDRKALQEASYSLFTRYLGINPFPLAASCGLLGVLAGIITYVFGRIYQRSLKKLDLYQVYSPSADGKSFLCLAPAKVFDAHKDFFLVYTEEGLPIGQAKALDWQKGKMRLQFADFKIPPDGSLISPRALDAKN